MIWWIGLTLWEFEFPFSGSPISTFLGRTREPDREPTGPGEIRGRAGLLGPFASWFLVFGFRFLVLGSWCLVLGAWFLVLGFWLLIVFFVFLFFVLRSWIMVPQACDAYVHMRTYAPDLVPSRSCGGADVP